MSISFFSLASLVVFSCSTENNITNLKTFNPSLEDTSSEPQEIVDTAVVEEPLECPDRIHSATLCATDESCFIERSVGRFDPIKEWSMGSFEEYPHLSYILTFPAIGHMTDDDGDGNLGSAADTPDIVTITMEGETVWFHGGLIHLAALRVVSGDGTQVHWTVHEVEYNQETYTIAPFMNPAIGDINNDGEPDIVVGLYPDDVSKDNRVAAFDRFGQVIWVSEATIDASNFYNLPTRLVNSVGLFDLNQDGQVEVFAANTILHGLDGSLYDPSFDHPGGESVVSDLNGDGTHEFVTAYGIYEQDLSLRCTFGSLAEFSAPADLNGDGIAEIVQTGAGELYIFSTQACELLFHQFSPDGGRLGPPTIADYDGDGLPEIGTASYDYYFVYDNDGTELWRRPVTDQSSNVTGSSVYDFDGDGYAEVVYAGEESLWIFDGTTGFPRLEDTFHSSGTLIEYPVTVDVDNDGQVEIIVGDFNGITVFGDKDESWVNARQVWNQHAYSITNVNDDLSIPSYNQPNWPVYNTFRSGDTRQNNNEGSMLIDLFPIEIDVCETECEAGSVQVAIQVGNQGLKDQPGEWLLSLYSEQEGEPVLLETLAGNELIRSGYSSSGIVKTYELSELPDRRLWVVIDDDGTGVGQIEECNEDNNSLLITGFCVE